MCDDGRVSGMGGEVRGGSRVSITTDDVLPRLG